MRIRAHLVVNRALYTGKHCINKYNAIQTYYYVQTNYMYILICSCYFFEVSAWRKVFKAIFFSIPIMCQFLTKDSTIFNLKYIFQSLIILCDIICASWISRNRT